MEFNKSENVNERCKVLINELTAGSPGILQKTDFIELFTDCLKREKKNKSLQEYKLIGISAGSGALDGMLIDLVVNLWNTKWNDADRSAVPITQLTIDSPYVIYRNKFSENTRDNISAEAKTSLSTLKYIEDYQRRRLTPKSLDAMMRININGSDELDHFAAVKYAHKWIKSGKYTNDNPANKRKVSTKHLIEIRY